MNRRYILGISGPALLVALLVACADAPEDDDAAATSDGATEALSAVGSFTARGTGYYPANSSLEGGTRDRRGKPLRTLQQFLAGQADYVAVAMDASAFPYGQRLRIRELEEKYGRPITFRVVDTGGAFSGKGRSRLDVCVRDRAASLENAVNGTLHVEVIGETSKTPSGGATNRSGAPSCQSHGDCNPGNEGSGKICVDGACVPGCTADWQCPGSTSCSQHRCS